MTDSAFLLSVLEDGQKHSQAALLARSFRERGHGCTIHSRIADLRKKGHYIVCERVPGADRGHAWTYQLVGSLPESDLTPVASLGDDGQAQHDRTGGGRSDSESEQPELFPSTTHVAPDWA